jgi:hypothetical protein
VVVVIPVALGVPAMIIFTPPTMIGGPAAVALLRQFMAPMVGLTAVISVVLDGVMEFVIDFGYALLAVITGSNGWGGRCKSKDPCQYGCCQ